MELRDQNPRRYQGQGVLKALKNIETALSPLISGEDPCEQAKIDQIFIKSDSTPNKKRFGGNAILAASCAIAKAGALKKHVHLFQHFSDLANNDHPLKIPTPMFNIMNGGVHAGMALDFQEFMVIPNPISIPNYPDQLETCATLTHELKHTLTKHSFSGSVGDEGGFAPTLKRNRDAINLIKETTALVKHQFGTDIRLGIDCAANTYFRDQHFYIRDFPKPLTASEYENFLLKLVDEYHLFSLEDIYPEDAWDRWQAFTRRAGDRLTIIGDDLLVTNPGRLERAIKEQACNGIIVKPNQIGTITEAVDVVNLAKSHLFKTVISHRSGETTDTLIADFAVGVGADLVKFGAPIRGERVAKYNRLLRIHTFLDS
jgi:enolase